MCLSQCPHWTQVLIWVNAGRFPLLQRSHAWTPKERRVTSTFVVENPPLFAFREPWPRPQIWSVAVESVSKSVPSVATVSSEVEGLSGRLGGRVEGFLSWRLLSQSVSGKGRIKGKLEESRRRGEEETRPLRRQPLSLNDVTRHRRLLPLRRQTKRCRAGSAGIRPATSPPSAWPEGGCGVGSFSGGRPGPRPPSRSSPATPAAASPAALRSPSVGDKGGR